MNSQLLYEVNTRCWLNELSRMLGRRVHLGNVPDEALQHWVDTGFTHVWLMGVWKTDDRSRDVAIGDPLLRDRIKAALPDWKTEDIAGSPYAIGEYAVAEDLGGNEGLASLRARVNATGLKLILDFVPNHVGLNHSWLRFWPDLFVPGTPGDPGSFLVRSQDGEQWIAHGKDPYFPAWRDTAQLDFRRPETHKAMLDALKIVATQCDGVRCDMAMLVLRDVFENTWKTSPPSAPATDRQFWSHAIPAVKESHPEFIFLAEVYWDLEPELQQLGFDFTYDKWLYDHLRNGNGSEARKQLRSVDREVLARSVHFLENHDEPRAAGVFSLAEYRAALTLVCGLPGMRLFHYGQLEGARVDLPVQLSRRTVEQTNTEIAAFILGLLKIVRGTSIGSGDWKLLTPFPAWSTNKSHENVVVMQWRAIEDRFELVVVNLAVHEAQCFVHPEIVGLHGRDWRMTDLLGDQDFLREGRDIVNRGLYLALEPHAAHIFHFRPATPAEIAEEAA
ncbi:MAG: alpha-amylase [Verrucomicrobiae bacterium]|nr:alpha-amylase [Verrucomicrobiae bacterium]